MTAPTRSPGAAQLIAGRSHVTGRALGCSVHLATADSVHLADAARTAATLLDQVDAACSRFRVDSDLVRANAGAGRWVRVSPLLAAAVRVAVQAARDTDGLVDPMLGQALVHVGYDRDFALVPAVSAEPTALPAPRTTGGWREIQVDPEGAVRVPAGQLLDLGATAKAWAADLVAEALVRRTGDTVVVSVGGDVRVGTPRCPHEWTDADGWPVVVTERPRATADAAQSAAARQALGTNPNANHDQEAHTMQAPSVRTHEAAPALLHLPPGGLATSSTLARRWQRGGTAVHHLLDPRTGSPAHGPWRSVSATGSTAVQANTTTTAALVLGAGAEAWLAARSVPARLVGVDGRIVVLGGWPHEEVTS